MSIESAIHEIATTDADLSAVILKRCHPLKMPQDPTYPSVTYQLVATDPVHAFGVDSDCEIQRFHIDTWAKSYSSLHATRRLVRKAFSRYKNQSISNVMLADVLLNTELTIYDDTIEIYHHVHDFTFYFRDL